jgi:ATP-binding cassette, subfamily G (WHITE), member 2, SNQ2
MYHPFTEALALALADIPITFIMTLLFTVVIYPLTRLQQSASQFFIFFIFVFIATLTMKSFSRCLAAGFGSEAPAQAAAGVALLALTLYTGSFERFVDQREG